MVLDSSGFLQTYFLCLVLSHIMHTDRAFTLASLRVDCRSQGRVVPHDAVDGLSLSWRSPGLGPLRSSSSVMGLRSQWSPGWVLCPFLYPVLLLIKSFLYPVQSAYPPEFGYSRTHSQLGLIGKDREVPRTNDRLTNQVNNRTRDTEHK